ncbi:hypothetical protein [Streptomyces sp. NPDC097610]|uniref:hypothetical protein n=1 Tax=Streptomyces sp. NPDC097610 TaxID=3157227 RepID=UPI0033217D9C
MQARSAVHTASAPHLAPAAAQDHVDQRERRLSVREAVPVQQSLHDGLQQRRPSP